MDNLGKIGRSLMDNWGGGGGGIRQLINILFCGYRSDIREKCEPKPILVWGTGAPASNKAAGLDKIPPKLLKDSAVVVTPYLNLIFNLSLSEGNFPND